jgi:hypothetical protein
MADGMVHAAVFMIGVLRPRDEGARAEPVHRTTRRGRGWRGPGLSSPPVPSFTDVGRRWCPMRRILTWEQVGHLTDATITGGPGRGLMLGPHAELLIVDPPRLVICRLRRNWSPAVTREVSLGELPISWIPLTPVSGVPLRGFCRRLPSTPEHLPGAEFLWNRLGPVSWRRIATFAGCPLFALSQLV